MAGAAMPLQKIETVDEPRARSEAQGEVFDAQKAHLDDFRNMLIWGDNKPVLASLLKDFRGKVDLVYVDPPFDVGADFTLPVPIGDAAESVTKDQSALELIAYRDMFGRGTDSYLHTMFDRFVLMRELLRESGSLCVHCDWHASHSLKQLLIELFGRDNYRNEIVWWYYNKLQGNVGQFAANHDVILWFSKSKHFKFNPVRELRDRPKRQQKRVWDPTSKRLKQARDEAGQLVYYTETERTLDDVWRIPYLMPADLVENVRFETQKPVELVGRFIDALTEPGDIVADVFCGSGTTIVAADGLRARRKDNKKELYLTEARRWIGVDLGRFAIHTSRKRLIELQRELHANHRPYRAFDIFNLGRYERQWWQKEALKGADNDHRRVVLEFYKAEPLTHSASPLIHGRKSSALCHVDGIDSTFSREEARSVARAAKEAGAQEVACLAWEFEMDLRMVCNSLERELGVKIKLIQIPREIMEKNRKEPPPFLEVATLEVEPVYREDSGQEAVDIKLVRFLPSLAEVPTKELIALQERAIKSGFDFIDFWAVDFDFQNGGPFNHHWQDYRTRRDRSLKTVSEQRYVYPKNGRYIACVKVVDIFGCDTSVTVEVDYS